MKDLLDFLFDNPLLVLLVVAGLLGNLGSSKQRRQRQQRQQRRQPLPPRTAPPRPGEPEPWAMEAEPAPPEEDIARRIREVLGQPRGAARTAAEPQPVADGDRGDPVSDFQSFEGAEPLDSEPVFGAVLQRAAPRGGGRPPLLLPRRLRPEQAVLSMLLLGRCRAVESFDQDPSRGVGQR